MSCLDSQACQMSHTMHSRYLRDTCWKWDMMCVVARVCPGNVPHEASAPRHQSSLESATVQRCMSPQRDMQSNCLETIDWRVKVFKLPRDAAWESARSCFVFRRIEHMIGGADRALPKRTLHVQLHLFSKFGKNAISHRCEANPL